MIRQTLETITKLFSTLFEFQLCTAVSTSIYLIICILYVLVLKYVENNKLKNLGIGGWSPDLCVPSFKNNTWILKLAAALKTIFAQNWKRTCDGNVAI